jgi:hypothetical protein
MKQVKATIKIETDGRPILFKNDMLMCMSVLIFLVDGCFNVF